MHTTETDRVKTHVPPSFPTLRLLFSARADAMGRMLGLRPGNTPVGRDITDAEGIQLIGDTRASRQHAAFEVSEATLTNPGWQVRVTDNNSKNGIFVNGERVSTALLQDGDIIRIGNSFFLLRYENAQRADIEADPLRGQAPVMRALRLQLTQAARSQAPVLLLGESGAGKDVAAQALHRASGRRGPLLAVNCAAIPEQLAESQLFGHTAGAFSGARGATEGFFQAAEGGTLFLDEIGELVPALQPKLLRALDENAVLPVGATRPITCDVRLVAATNRDLRRAVDAGRFRGDLFARLYGVVLELPPLRARREDIMPLLLAELTTAGARPPQFTARLVEALLLYPWPYNVRELLQLAAVLKPHVASEQELDLTLVEQRLTGSSLSQHRGPRLLSGRGGRSVRASATASIAPEPPVDRERSAVVAELGQPRLPREVLERLWHEKQGNLSQLARIIGRSRRQVRRWLEYYGIVGEPHKD